MVLHTILFIFRTSWHRVGSSNFRNSSYQEKMDGSACMKTVAPPFSNHFGLNLNREKTCGNENDKKETKHIHTSAADLLHIRIGNLD